MVRAMNCKFTNDLGLGDRQTFQSLPIRLQTCEWPNSSIDTERGLNRSQKRTRRKYGSEQEFVETQ
jgi:hypothetical protein